MLTKHLAFVALSLASAAASANVTTGLLAARAVRPLVLAQATPHFQIFEALLNPPGSSDETKGQEYIAIKGTPNASLDGYALVIVENESGQAGLGFSNGDDRGTVDNVFPLDGKSTDANGILVIRDFKGDKSSKTNTTLGAIAGERSVAAANALDVEFSNTLTSSLGWSFPSNVYTSGGSATLSWGGQGLENGGGNYFLVKHVNPSLVQKTEQNSGSVASGTRLDRDIDGTLDFLETSKPIGWVQPWEAVEDAVFIPEQTANIVSGQVQFNYVSGVTANTKFMGTQDANSTADFFARLDGTSAVLTDIVADGSGFQFVTSECFFEQNGGTKISLSTANFSVDANTQTVNGTTLPPHVQRGWYAYFFTTVGSSTYEH